MGHGASPRSRAEAAARRRRSHRRRTRDCSRRRAAWRASATRTSCRCTAPSSTTTASACGWSSCAASRSSRPFRRAARSARARPRSSGWTCARRSRRSTAPASCTATSRPRTSCARAAAASCSWTSAPAKSSSGTNRLVGTPLYLAPEIFRGQRASVQSDLYSLGVLLFYLVTGKFPVMAGSMEQLARAHAHRERQPLRDLRPDLPEAFVATVERALDSDPTPALPERRRVRVGAARVARRARRAARSFRRRRPCGARASDLHFWPRRPCSSRSSPRLIVWSGWQPGVPRGVNRERGRSAARRQVRRAHRICQMH